MNGNEIKLDSPFVPVNNPNSSQNIKPMISNKFVPQNLNVAQQPTDVNSLYNNYISDFSEQDRLKANSLQEVYNEYGKFGQSIGNINSIYNDMNNKISPYYENFAKLNQGISKDIVGKLGDGLNLAFQSFGPEGKQTQLVDNYYRELGKNLAQQNAVQQGTVTANARSSGVNDGAIRAARNTVNANTNAEFMKAKQSEIQNYATIANSLQQYIDNFITKYGNSNDKYVRDTYNRLLQYQEGLVNAQGAASSAIEQARLQRAITPRTSTIAPTTTGLIKGITTPTTPQVTYDVVGSPDTAGRSAVAFSDGTRGYLDNTGALYKTQ